jgi:hypothetical protein
MLSNIIILLPDSPPHILSPVPHTQPTTLFAFLTTLSLGVVCGSLVEGVAQVLKLAHSFYLAFFPLPLALLILTLSRSLHVHFQLFLLHVRSQAPHHFFHLSHSLPQSPYRPQTPGSKLSPCPLRSHLHLVSCSRIYLLDLTRQPFTYSSLLHTFKHFHSVNLVERRPEVYEQCAHPPPLSSSIRSLLNGPGCTHYPFPF